MSSLLTPCTRSRVSTRIAGEIPVHRGHVQVHAAGEVALEQAGAGAFALQVELVFEHLLDFGDHLERADLVGVRMPALRQLAQRTQQRARRGRCAASMPGRSTFTTTARPSCKRGRMHLGDRGRGQRRLVEAGVQLGRPARSARARRWRGPRCRGTADLVLQQASSSAMSAGTRSRRVDSTWPALTKIGPSSVSATAQARAARQRVHVGARLRRTSGRTSFSGRNRWAASTSSSSRQASSTEATRSSRGTTVSGVMPALPCRRCCKSLPARASSRSLRSRSASTPSRKPSTSPGPIASCASSRTQSALSSVRCAAVSRAWARPLRMALRQRHAEHVAEGAGERLLEIRSELAGQLLQSARQFGIAGDLHLARAPRRRRRGATSCRAGCPGVAATRSWLSSCGGPTRRRASSTVTASAISGPRRCSCTLRPFSAASFCCVSGSSDRVWLSAVSSARPASLRSGCGSQELGVAAFIRRL